MGSDGVEPPTLNVPRIYSPVPFRSGNFPQLGGPGGIRTHNRTALEADATANCATGPLDQRYRSRNRKGMVWTAGFEPATTRFQGADSDQAELHPEKVGRGSMRFIGEF